MAQAFPAGRFALESPRAAGPPLFLTRTGESLPHEQPKIHIIGIGDDGLDGLTSPARQLIDEAELLVGAEATLAKFRRPRPSGWSSARISTRPSNGSPAAGDQADRGAGLGRSAVLRRGPLSVRQAGQGPLRGRAARQQHAVGLRPGEGKLGRSLPDEPGQSPAGPGAGTDSRRPTRSGCSPATPLRRAAVAKAMLDRRIDYFSAYVCENLGSPDERVTQGELAEIAATGVFAAERDDPGPQAERARPAQRGDRPPAVRQSRRSVSAIEAQAGAAHAGRSPGDGPGRVDLGPTSIVWDIGAGSGSVAIEAAQIASGGTVYAIEMDPRITS